MEGDLIEVRPKNKDELYYNATIVSYQESSGTFTVCYEDNTEESGLFSSSMIVPSQRSSVFEDEFLKVVDGHMVINETFRRARLLSFIGSPGIYQSAILFGDDGFDYETLAFDVDQAIILILPIFLGVANDQITPSILLFGAGAGSIPMALHSKECNMEVVELSDKVLLAAFEHFGVPKEDEKLVFHLEDARHFSKEGKSFDIIIVDVADSKSEVDPQLELPPAAFLEHGFFENVKKLMHERSWVVYNVIAKRDKLLELLDTFPFTSIYILAVDPNYVFMMSNVDIDIDHHDISRWCHDYKHMAYSVLEEVKNSSYYLENEILLGWFTKQDFRTFLANENVLV